MSKINNIYSTNNKSDGVNDEINSYTELPKGWNFGQELPINKTVVNIAISLYQTGKYYGFLCEPSPMSSGGINLTFFLYEKDVFLDVYINSDYTIDLRKEKGFGKPYQVLFKKININVDTFTINLLEIKSECDTSLGLYLLKNTKQAKEDLTTLTLFVTGKAEFQYSIRTV